jgi:flagellar assembly protein FliH
MQTNGLSDNGNKISIDVQVDNRISPGGLRLDSEVGTVDARLETRLANVEKAFQDVLQDE